MTKEWANRLSEFSSEDIMLAQLELTQSAPFFDIELSSNCNIHCLMCPREELERTSSMMKKEVMHHLIDWFPSHAKVMLAGLGEPLLHPQAFEFLCALKKRGLETGITTNGLLLTSERVKKLNESRVDLIQISFHAASEEKYNKIVKGGSFNRLMENLFCLSEQINGCSEVKLTVTVQKENEEEIEEIQKIAKRWGFGLFIRNCHSRAGANYSPSSFFPYLPVCGIFAKVCFIDSDGNILSCCQDLKGKIKLGHIDQFAFSDLVSKKRRIIQKKKEFSICKLCDDEYRYYLIAEHLKKQR